MAAQIQHGDCGYEGWAKTGSSVPLLFLTNLVSFIRLGDSHIISGVQVP